MCIFSTNNYYRDQLRDQQERRNQYHDYLRQCVLEQYEQVRLLAYSPTFTTTAVTYQEIVFPPLWCLNNYSTGAVYAKALEQYAAYLEKYFTGHGFNGLWVFQDATFVLADNVQDFQSRLKVSFILDGGLTEEDRQQILEEFGGPGLESQVDSAYLDYDQCFSLDFTLYTDPTPKQLAPIFVKMIEHLWQLDRLFTLTFAVGTMSEVIGGWGDFKVPQEPPYDLGYEDYPRSIDYHLDRLRFFLEHRAEAFLREPEDD